MARTPAGVAAIAASMMTSGQFLGVLFAMFLGILLMTNEFAHQTATATFLTVPRRALVIVAKLTAAACFGALFWLVATVMSGVTTPFYLHSQHISTTLTGWIVVRSVLLNLLAFVIWAIFGLGLGALIRSQVTAVVAGVAVYLGGFAAVELIFHGIYYFYPHELGTRRPGHRARGRLQCHDHARASIPARPAPVGRPADHGRIRASTHSHRYRPDPPPRRNVLTQPHVYAGLPPDPDRALYRVQPASSAIITG